MMFYDDKYIYVFILLTKTFIFWLDFHSVQGRLHTNQDKKYTEKISHKMELSGVQFYEHWATYLVDSVFTASS